jgi:preprotein translocase subunit SecG
MLLFLILIIVACVVMAFFILVQNPKGGGLSGSIAGFSTQFMGVKQTTDVLEKGTWVLAVVIALLSVFSIIFIPKGSDDIREINTRPQSGATAPATTPPGGSPVQPPR